MKFLIDAQLPESLSEFFSEHDIVHTRSLKSGNKTKDKSINILSVNEKRIVITKDTDFYYSYIASKKPYKLVLVKLGNMRIAELKRYFKANTEKIIDVLAENSFIILEPDKIRILD